ncbi:hypothetical protein EDB89DRAFT_2154021 [Lactarius sanguifluus]|nr:hypothetical protein EDB89DRAFT_2154021 [Lactarius sanguifluus]
MPLSPPSSSISPTDSERLQLATDVQPQNEPKPAFAYPDIQLLSPSLPIALESQPAHALLPADGQLKPMPASPVSPPVSLTLTTPALLHTPQLALPLIDDTPEPLSTHPTPQPTLMIPSLELSHSTPLPSEIPSQEIASSPSMPLPHLDYVLTTVVVNLDAVPLSSPEQPPSSLSDIKLSLSAPLKFSPSVTILPCPSPIGSTPVTPPGLLKSSPNNSITSPSQCLLRLSPKGPIMPPSMLRSFRMSAVNHVTIAGSLRPSDQLLRIPTADATDCELEELPSRVETPGGSDAASGTLRSAREIFRKGLDS